MCGLGRAKKLANHNEDDTGANQEEEDNEGNVDGTHAP